MAGRKNKYESHVAPHIKDISSWRKEMTEAEIAEKLNISVTTLEKYKNDYPELAEALKLGKKELAKNLKESLIKRALGFSYTESRYYKKVKDGVIEEITEENTKVCPPDVGAIHLILKNIDPKWRNDDMETVKLKRKKIDLEKQKTENDVW